MKTRRHATIETVATRLLLDPAAGLGAGEPTGFPQAHSSREFAERGRIVERALLHGLRGPDAAASGGEPGNPPGGVRWEFGFHGVVFRAEKKARDRGDRVTAVVTHTSPKLMTTKLHDARSRIAVPVAYMAARTAVSSFSLVKGFGR